MNSDKDDADTAEQTYLALDALALRSETLGQIPRALSTRFIKQHANDVHFF